MTGNYKQIDHTADIAFKVSGESLEELFTAAAEAWRNSVVEETQYYKRESKAIEIKSSLQEQLLVGFLNELNYYLFTRKWLFNLVQKMKIKNENDAWVLTGEIEGMTLSAEIEIKREIKAITFHQMNIEKIGNQYSTLLVFDI